MDINAYLNIKKYKGFYENGNQKLVLVWDNAHSHVFIKQKNYWTTELK